VFWRLGALLGLLDVRTLSHVQHDNIVKATARFTHDCIGHRNFSGIATAGDLGAVAALTAYKFEAFTH
jgi:hypothetical protein